MAVAKDIFAPFSAFQWTSGNPKRSPVGVSNEEVEKVAWLVTCAPYVSENLFLDAAEGLRYAIHLQRDGVVADRLYKRLDFRTDELVSITEVESELNCKWGEIDVELNGHPRRIDPYFWKLIETDVRNSCAEYVRALDLSVTQLAGLDPAQITTQVHYAMDRMVRSVGHYLADYLLSRDTDQARMLLLLQRLRNTYATEHVGMVKERLRANIQGFVALNRCSAAAAGEFDELLQEGEEAITRLIALSPKDFVDHLSRGGAQLSELSSVFCMSTDGLVTVRNSPPASFGVRATLLKRWLNKHKTIVSEACVAQMAVSRRMCDLPPDHMAWSNVELCRNSPDDVRTREALDANLHPNAVVAWKPPLHLGDNGEPRLLVCADPANGQAVRACRVIEVLLQQANLGMLPAMTVNANKLLPVVSRFTVENKFNYGVVVDMKLRPVAKAAGAFWPEDARLYGGGKRRALQSPPAFTDGSDEDEPGVLPAVSAPLIMLASPPGPMPIVQRADMGAVPLEMQRDHAVLHSLAALIRVRAGAPGLRISLDEICESVRRLSPALSNKSPSALKQVVVHVSKRASQRAAAESPGFMIKYSGRRDRSADGRVDGIVCDAPGASVLLKYVDYCMHKMRFNGKEFASEWPVSRSAITHARAVAREKSGLGGWGSTNRHKKLQPRLGFCS